MASFNIRRLVAFETFFSISNLIYPKDRIFALKFSKSPYYDNHCSESFQTCTIESVPQWPSDCQTFPVMIGAVR